MTNLLLNTFCVAIMLFFGAMAYYPLFIRGNESETPVDDAMEDRVISVVPASIDTKRPVHIGAATPLADGPEHPGHRPAA